MPIIKYTKHLYRPIKVNLLYFYIIVAFVFLEGRIHTYTLLSHCLGDNRVRLSLYSFMTHGCLGSFVRPLFLLSIDTFASVWALVFFSVAMHFSLAASSSSPLWWLVLHDSWAFPSWFVSGLLGPIYVELLCSFGPLI